MNKPAMLAASVLLVGLGGCDRIPFLGKKAPPADTTTMVAAAAPPDTVTPPPGPAEPAVEAPRRVSLQPATDEPWTPVDTGTVSPGMTRDQVIAVWGVPVAERAAGGNEFLFFRNGCEVSCGTFDVVFLEGGQVVDAVVRGVGHTYAGVSSSPPDRKAEMTPPGGRLVIPGTPGMP